MRAQHTPGPWSFFDEQGPLSCDGWRASHNGIGSTVWQPVKAASGEVIALVVKQSEEHWVELNTEHDARLITAAPDLLEALIGHVEAHAIQSSICKERKAYDKARAAIAKATGTR